MLSLIRAIAFLSCAIVAVVATVSDASNNHLGLYNVLVDDGVELLENAAWAQGIHMRNARQDDDISLGLMKVTGPDTYEFYTDEATAETVRKHPKVSLHHSALRRNRGSEW